MRRHNTVYVRESKDVPGHPLPALNAIIFVEFNRRQPIVLEHWLDREIRQSRRRRRAEVPLNEDEERRRRLN